MAAPLLRLLLISALTGASLCTRGAEPGSPLPPLPEKARLVLHEDWSGGRIDSARWYLPRKKWGAGNHGVTAENVRLERDIVAGREQHVLVCQANGDRYDGPLVGHDGQKQRVGGMIVSKEFFASGRFEVVLKIGAREPHPGGPADPRRPIGAVPAVWTYAYRTARVAHRERFDFHPDVPLYNPQVRSFGTGITEYWSELDFPEFGKAGDFNKALYNTFLQNRHEPLTFDVAPAIDGQYHTLVTEWRTALQPLDGITDAQVREHAGYWWIRDRSVPIERYLGNPLTRLGPDRYALHAGTRADHWLDGRKVGENLRYVPAMAAQLTIGIWLPDWGGPAPWQTAALRVAAVKVWQYDDPGDVRGILTEDLPDNFAADGRVLR